MADAGQSEVADATSQLRKLADFVKQLKTADKDRAKRINEEAAASVRAIEKSLRSVETDAKSAPPSSRRQKQEVLAQLRQELTSRRSEMQKINDSMSRDNLLSRTAIQQVSRRWLRHRCRTASTDECWTRRLCRDPSPPPPLVQARTLEVDEKAAATADKASS